MNMIDKAEISEFTMEDSKPEGFKVFQILAFKNVPAQARRDFHKIVLITGNMTAQVSDQRVTMNGTFLFFANPLVHHSIVHYSPETEAYACLFTEAFVAGRERTEILHNSPLFRFDTTPVIPLNSEEALLMKGLFRQMLAAYEEDYKYRNELIRNCIELIVHEALRIQPSQNGLKHLDAATRITHLFVKLLESQFPIESVANPLRLRTAQDFAASLSIHINYLNRSVKSVTGKSTSAHIAERIVAEAKALLRYTDWSVADIADSLGFAYATYFNNYFKRVTGSIPKSFRARQV